jgi:hypothetical protein
LKAKRDGIVTATAKIVHKGRSIHLWEIRITDERNNLISLCKLTNMILPKGKAKINNGITCSESKTLAGRTPFVLYCKPNTIEVVGFFSGMLHFFKLMILQKRICYFVFDGKTPFDS